MSTEIEIVGYLRASPEGKPEWSEDCVCVGAVYPNYDGDESVSMPICRLADAQAIIAQRDARIAELENCIKGLILSDVSRGDYGFVTMRGIAHGNFVRACKAVGAVADFDAKERDIAALKAEQPTTLGQFLACKGTNCTSADGFGHSAECEAEHAAAAGSGNLDTPGNRNPEMRYAGYKGEQLQAGHSGDQKAAWLEGKKATVGAGVAQGIDIDARTAELESVISGLWRHIAELEAHAKRLGQGDADLKAQQSSNCLAAQVLKAQEAIKQWPPELRKGLRIPDFTEWLATDKPSAGQWPKQECPVTGAVTDVDPADMGGQPSAGVSDERAVFDAWFGQFGVGSALYPESTWQGWQARARLDQPTASAGVVVGALVSALEGIVHDERVPNEVSQDYAALLIEARRLNPCRAQAVPDGWRMVKVGSEGVRFGNAWISHERITGYTAEQLNSGDCHVTGRAYMEWLAAPPAPADAVSVPRELLHRLCPKMDARHWHQWNASEAYQAACELRALLAQQESKP